MEEDVLAPQPYGVEKYAWAHIVPLDTQQLLSIILEFLIVP